MIKLKMLSMLALTIVAIILVVQNTQEVETKLLFVSVTMPRAVLLIITTLIGFGLGLMTAILASKRKKKPLG